MKNWISIFALLIVSGLVPGMRPVFGANNCSCNTALVQKMLIVDNGKCQQAIIDCVLGEHHPQKQQVLFDELIAFLETESNHLDAAATATYILGEARVVKAIPVLIALLEVTFIGPIDDLPYRKDDPSSALIKIGEPSLDPLLEATAEYTAPQTHEMIGSMIYQICQSKEGARDYLEKRKSRFPDAVTILMPWVLNIKI